VSNNLQVVAAMLSLQQRHLDHDVARRALEDASARVALVGRISRALYDPSGAGQDMRAFLSTLAADILDASARQDVAVAVDAPDDLKLDSHVTVPLALIVAESVSNAIEHGLPHGAGTIRILLDQDATALTLCIADDGEGVAPDFQIGREQSSLGLRIAQALASQLGGRFTLTPGADRGAVATLTLPVVAGR
jgi:two-component sensor histidine kinase